MVKKILLTLIATFFCIAWTTNSRTNTAVCTAEQEQKRPQIVADGAGGAVLIWEDSRNGSDYDIYAQRVDSTGKTLWKKSGQLICGAIGHQRFPQITADGSGGFIVSWFDHRNGKNYDIYAQRINSTGTISWALDGTAVCTAKADQFDPIPVADGSGGAIITWQDRRNGNDYDIYAQRIDATGRLKWDANGVVVCNAKGEQNALQAASDDRGGAIIIWQDRRKATDYDIYVQRIDSNGTLQWGAGGSAVCTEKEDQRLPNMIVDGSGNTLITWQDKRNGSDYDIYAQRLNNSGSIQWTNNGIGICTETNSQYEPRLVSDGQGGAVITWQDYRKGADCNFDAFDKENDKTAAVCDEKQLNDWFVYAQHINVSGRIQWTPNGITICASNMDQLKPQPVADGFGGTIITWRSADKENDHNIYAQRLDATGKAEWLVTGIPVTTAPGDQLDPLPVSDGKGGAIVVWYDKRQGNHFDIYMQKICASGEIGGCSEPVAVIDADKLNGIGKLTVHFNAGQSYDPDGSISLYRWNFGDGKKASTANATHTYVAPGSYTVVLRVRDNNGKWSSPSRKRVVVNPKS